MDLLRLPPVLRQSILPQRSLALKLQRYVSTEVPIHHRPYDHPYTPPPPPVESEESSPALLTLSPTTLNSYIVSNPPGPSQLKYASNFFHSAPPTILFSAAHFRSFPPSPFPEVAFLGRSNVGKSSLLNALFGRTKVKDAHVSKRPGRTRTMNGFGVSGGAIGGAAPERGGDKDAAWKRFPRGGLVVVDMPGYGAGSREDWGKEALKYLEQRRQLRRTFVLVDTEHGLKASDIAILTHLRRKGISHQIILSKVDKLFYSGSKVTSPQKISNNILKLRDLCANIRRRLEEEAGDRRESAVDILCCTAEKSLDKTRRHWKMGVDEVRWAVLSACGMECDENGRRKRQPMEEINVLDENKLKMDDGHSPLQRLHSISGAAVRAGRREDVRSRRDTDKTLQRS